MEAAVTATATDRMGRLAAGAAYVLGFAVVIPAVHLLLGVSLDRLGGNPLESAPAWISRAGGLIAVAGLTLIVTSAAALHRAGRGFPLSSSPPERLVEIGPYRRLRHPIYTGAVMLFVGSAIVLGSFWSAAVTGPLLGFFYFAYAAGIEEPALRERYGPRYAEYGGRAAFFLPFPLRGRLTRIAAGLLGWLSRAANRPAIFRRGDHILFWGYGIWVGAGIALGLAAMEFVLIAAGMEPGRAAWGVAVATLAGLAGSRVGWRVLTSVGERTSYRHTSSRVGFVSWGAPVALLVLLPALALISGESLLRYLDAAFPALMIAQMVGRVGCTFYGCCYGRETESSLHLHYTHPALKAVRQGRVNAGRLMPAQLLSVVNGGLIALVVFGLWLARPLPLGVPAALTATLYGLCRLGEEWVRSHDSLLLGPVSHAQVVALLLALVGLAFLLLDPADHTALYYTPGRSLDAVRVLQQLHPALLAAAGLLTAALFSYHYRAVGRWR